MVCSHDSRSSRWFWLAWVDSPGTNTDRQTNHTHNTTQLFEDFLYFLFLDFLLIWYVVCPPLPSYLFPLSEQVWTNRGLSFINNAFSPSFINMSHSTYFSSTTIYTKVIPSLSLYYRITSFFYLEIKINSIHLNPPLFFLTCFNYSLTPPPPLLPLF